MPAASVSIHSTRGDGRARVLGARVMPGSVCKVERHERPAPKSVVGAPAARSVLLTVLGEYVCRAATTCGRRPCSTRSATLGYKPEAARRAIARSVTAGWLRDRAVRPPLVAGAHARRRRRCSAVGRASGSTASASHCAWDGHWLLRRPARARGAPRRAPPACTRSSRGRLWARWACGLWISPARRARGGAARLVGRGHGGRPAVASARRSARSAIPARASRRPGT